MADVYNERDRVLDAVKIFRARAGLHDNSPASALIKFAHGAGKDRPFAETVREAWHDFEIGRRFDALPVERYVTDYGSADTPPPITGDPVVIGDGVEGVDYTVNRETGLVTYIDDEEMRDGRPTGRDLDTYLDAESGEWVSQEELHKRQRRRAVGMETIAPEALNDPKPKGAAETAQAMQERGDALREPEEPEPEKKAPGAPTALDEFDDEEVLF